jgi:hypothetical protein
MEAFVQSYMRKGFLIYEGMRKSYMRRPLVIFGFATAPYWISLYMRNIFFSFFISACAIVHGRL